MLGQLGAVGLFAAALIVGVNLMAEALDALERFLIHLADDEDEEP